MLPFVSSRSATTAPFLTLIGPVTLPPLAPGHQCWASVTSARSMNPVKSRVLRVRMPVACALPCFVLTAPARCKEPSALLTLRSVI